MSEEPLIKLEMLFGHCELQSRLALQEDGSFVGEGRKLTYDRNGKLVDDSGWKSNGLVMRYE